VPIGRYELMFSVGEYFAARGVPMSDPPFLDKIPLRFFSVSDPEGPSARGRCWFTPWELCDLPGAVEAVGCQKRRGHR